MYLVCVIRNYVGFQYDEYLKLLFFLDFDMLCIGSLLDVEGLFCGYECIFGLYFSVIYLIMVDLGVDFVQ